MKHDEIIADCNRRMKLADKMMTTNYELSQVIWWEAFQRAGAAIEAKLQERNMHHTTGYPADLRIELCRN